MKYRIIEEIDGLDHSVFFAQYEIQTIITGRTKWVYENDYSMGHTLGPQRFETAEAALKELKKCHTPKKINIVQEGEL